MTCRELADFIAEYLAGALPAETLAEFERHLHVCPNCVTYLEGYRVTLELGRGAFTDPGREEIPEDLVKAILSARSS